MIDIWSEETLTLPQAAEALTLQFGKPVSIRALYRWASAGIAGVVLETVNAAGGRRTSKRAIAEFCARSAAARNGTPPPPAAPKTPRATELCERSGW